MVSPTRLMSTVTTRPATQADYHFLYTLHKLALGLYVEATWGWDEEFQGKRFRDEWEPTANQVVLLGGEPIGCLRVEDHDDHVFVDYIALMPEHQRHGIGASMFGPGTYRPDPTEGLTAIAALPPPEIVP
jgi:GNAT superfamily N-acetyltransferase